MSDSESPNSSDNLCVVCFKTAEIYSVGICDHPVCFECSTRMRVLCKQNECPICRGDMSKVIFTKKKEPFSTLLPKFEKSNLQDRKFGLIFCTSDIKKTYEALLEHRCQICRDWPYKTFIQLKDHMRKDHELFYCDICVENLKIFTSERRCYNRQELGQHRRKGDPDNTSHRGHPLCEFCDVRFMDSDELFRHLRRNHLYCHFCDSDGKHQYYNQMNDLIRHFREEHYLCDEGECKNMPLTAVFRTDIDLKAHIATEHSKFMSKSATKQARTLELEFTLAPRLRSMDLNRNKSYSDRRDRMEEDTCLRSHNMEPGGPGGGDNEGSSRVFMNPLTPQNFPALGGGSSNITVHTRPTTSVNFTSKLNSNFNLEDFPSLSGSKFTPTPEFTIKGTVRGKQGLARTNNNFPALGGSSSNSNSSSTVRLSVNSQDSASQLSIQVNHRPNGDITTHITTSASTSTQHRPTEAFPALGNTTKLVQPQWVQVKSKKQEPKASKVAPAPQLTPSSLEQFPSLSRKAPLNQNNWVNLNNISKTASNSAKASSTNNNNNSNKNNNVQQTSDNNKKSKAKSKQAAIATDSKPNEGKNEENSESKAKNKKKKNKNLQDVETGVTKATSSSKVETNNNLREEPKTPTKVEEINGSNLTTNSKKNVNGLVKKRSELHVGTLCNPEESSLSDEKDFPKLGETKPPPGFTVKPPPGLQPLGLEPSSISPTSFPTLGGADLTFTTSRGQSYSITPNNSYHPPNNFQTRNQHLIKRLMEILNNSDVTKEFKTYSDLFRNGGYPTKNYYEHCRSVLGEHFDDIFPELTVLLPDIPKQQELYNSYNGRNKKNLLVCEHCKQIIYKRELSEHYNYHILENQFPTLGKVQQVESAWKH